MQQQIAHFFIGRVGTEIKNIISSIDKPTLRTIDIANLALTGNSTLKPRAHKALASAQGIHVVELPSYTVHHGIPDHEQRRLVQTVRTVLVGQ